MKFFEIVLLVVAALYVWMFTPTVRRYYHEIVCVRSFAHRIQRWRPSLLTKFVAFLLLFVLAPLCCLWLKKHDDQVEEERQRQRRQIDEKKQLRALQRRDWFVGNKPKLYFNTVSGVTAVLRPVDYERAKRDTQNARTNELWAHAVLRPVRETFTFVTKSGDELIGKNGGSARRYKVAGWLSDLQELCQATECSLVRDETIFVPWINETLVSFDDQHRILMDCYGQASTVELIDKQAPVEFQPIH